MAHGGADTIHLRLPPAHRHIACWSLLRAEKQSDQATKKEANGDANTGVRQPMAAGSYIKWSTT